MEQLAYTIEYHDHNQLSRHAVRQCLGQLSLALNFDPSQLSFFDADLQPTLLNQPVATAEG